MNKLLVISALSIFIISVVDYKTDILNQSIYFVGAGVGQEKEHRILFTGDVMLGRFVETLMQRNSNDYPFEKISKHFDKYDSVLINLEGPITDLNINPENDLSFHFKPSITELLIKNNINIVTLGNNHSYDQGHQGFFDTKENLSSTGIKYFGSAINSLNSLIYEDGENNIVHVGVNMTWNQDIEHVIEKISEIEKKKFTIISVHWGDEYELNQSNDQQEFARKFIDSGADLIIGHHPHVVQGLEIYKEKVIFYSLGNFVFDQYFSKDVEEGLLVDVMLREDEVTYQLIPIESMRSQPSLMSLEDSKLFVDSILERSLNISSQIVKNNSFTVSID